MPASRRNDWSGRPDLNRRPPAPKAGALPGCATPRHEVHPIIKQSRREPAIHFDLSTRLLLGNNVRRKAMTPASKISRAAGVVSGRSYRIGLRRRENLQPGVFRERLKIFVACDQRNAFIHAALRDQCIAQPGSMPFCQNFGPQLTGTPPEAIGQLDQWNIQKRSGQLRRKPWIA